MRILMIPATALAIVFAAWTAEGAKGLGRPLADSTLDCIRGGELGTEA